jgi:hypothetical protein
MRLISWIRPRGSETSKIPQNIMHFQRHELKIPRFEPSLLYFWISDLPFIQK